MADPAGLIDGKNCAGHRCDDLGAVGGGCCGCSRGGGSCGGSCRAALFDSAGLENRPVIVLENNGVLCRCTVGQRACVDRSTVRQLENEVLVFVYVCVLDAYAILAVDAIDTVFTVCAVDAVLTVDTVLAVSADERCQPLALASGR